MSTHAPVPPGGIIGIVGGGQLGRMLALDAARLGFKVHVFCPDADSPAFDVAAAHVLASYEDEDALTRFAAGVDVVTYEFENVPHRTAEVLGNLRPLFPGARALAVAQDRLAEKTFLQDLGIPIAEFRAVDDLDGLNAALADLGHPSVLKTRRFGYDGKGQIMVREDIAPEDALAVMRGQPAVLEAFVPFVREVSVVAARDQDGAFAAYDVTENRHQHHVLSTSTVPADVSDATRGEAVAIARRITDALDYVGVIGVEMFVVASGADEHVLVNEIAPRVHNSGHWTQDGAATSQFEQHIRAIAGWPLGDARCLAPTQMTNLLGDAVLAWAELAAEPGTRLHLYGKAEARAGCKMGHVNRRLPSR